MLTKTDFLIIIFFTQMNFTTLHCGVHHIHFDDITGVMPIAIISVVVVATAIYAVKRYNKSK